MNTALSSGRTLIELMLVTSLGMMVQLAGVQFFSMQQRLSVAIHEDLDFAERIRHANLYLGAQLRGSRVTGPATVEGMTAAAIPARRGSGPELWLGGLGGKGCVSLSSDAAGVTWRRLYTVRDASGIAELKCQQGGDAPATFTILRGVAIKTLRFGADTDGDALIDHWTEDVYSMPDNAAIFVQLNVEIDSKNRGLSGTANAESQISVPLPDGAPQEISLMYWLRVGQIDA